MQINDAAAFPAAPAVQQRRVIGGSPFQREMEDSGEVQMPLNGAGAG